MKSQQLAIVAVSAFLAVAGCSKPKTDTTTTTTTTDATPAPGATATPPSTDPASTSGDLHNTDPTQSKAAAAPAKP